MCVECIWLATLFTWFVVGFLVGSCMMHLYHHSPIHHKPCLLHHHHRAPPIDYGSVSSTSSTEWSTLPDDEEDGV